MVNHPNRKRKAAVSGVGEAPGDSAGLVPSLTPDRMAAAWSMWRRRLTS